MKKYLFLLIGFAFLPKLWSSENLSLTYEMTRNASDQSIINVKAEITNSGAEDIYFLSESCNGLDYYLGTHSTKAQILILIHCNASFPRKITLKANSSYEFKTRVKLSGKINELALTLKLYLLNKSTDFGKKGIQTVQNEFKSELILLKGPSIRMETVPIGAQ